MLRDNLMKNKGFILGLALGLIVMATFAAVSQPVQIGRYQMGTGMLNKAYVIDTATGIVWHEDDVNFKSKK